MPVTSTQPIVIPAKEFDKLWVTVFNSMSQAPNMPVNLIATLTPYNSAGDVGNPINLGPYDVVEICQTDPEAAQIYGLIMAWLQKKARAEGKI